MEATAERPGTRHPRGRLRKAPENFIDADGRARVFAGAKQDGATSCAAPWLPAGAAGSAAAAAQAAPSRADDGDPAILNLPEHSRGLGQAVATDGYGRSAVEVRTNVQRRQSPGLTQTAQASVSFAPLQSLFGIVTPSGLHFERHHRGWWDVDPTKHRLMVNGSDPSLDEDARRVHRWTRSCGCLRCRACFIECGANTGVGGATSRCRPCQVHARHARCSEFTGVPLKGCCSSCAGVDYRRGRYVLAEGPTVRR